MIIHFLRNNLPGSSLFVQHRTSVYDFFVWIKKNNLALDVIARGNLTNEDRQRFGHPLSDILFSCKFDYNVDCDAKDFTWYFDIDYGNCFVFNGLGSNLSQISPGMAYGLRMSFYVGFHENLTFFNAYNSMGGDGIHTLVS